MDKFIGQLDKYRSSAACFWLLLLLLMLGYTVFRLANGVNFESNILALLPNDHRNPLQEQVEEHTGAAVENSILYLIEVGPDDFEARYKGFVSLLESKQQELNIEMETSETLQKVTGKLNQTLKHYRYNFISDEFKQPLLHGETSALVQQSLQRLFSPLPSTRVVSFQQDPFSIYSHWLAERFASNHGATANIALNQTGTVYAFKETFYRLLVLHFSGNVFANKSQEKLLAVLSKAETELRSHGQQVWRAGLIFHAAAGAKQAKQEMSTIGVGSLLAVILLFILSYRSVKPLLFTLLAILTGCLSALCVSLLVFQKIHLITLAFGASLIGVSVDYCFHFFSAKQYYAKAQTAINRITPAVFMGLLSSVLAYGAQMLTPFPGLQQMAVFSVAGLISVWLTVVLCLPFVFNKAENSRSLSENTDYLIKLLPNEGMAKSLFIVSAVAILLFAGYGVLHIRANDDIRLLQTSPQSLIDQERTVREVTAVSGSGQYFVIYAQTPEKLLVLEERLCAELRNKKLAGLIDNIECISQLIPSAKTQQENYALQEKYIYGLPVVEQTEQVSKLALDNLLHSVGAGENEVDAIKALFREGQGHLLKFDSLSQTLDSTPFGDLYLGVIKDKQRQAYVSVVRVGGVEDAAEMAKLPLQLKLTNNCYFVDKVGFISGLLKQYRQEMIFIASVAYILVFALLFVRYKFNALQIVAPVTLAALSVLGLFSINDTAINLFSVLGFMLLLGVGLDMGIFLFESHAQKHSLQAITLSAVTTIFAFGLLSLSNTPVLHNFGIVVLPGIAITWLLAWLLFSARLTPQNTSEIMA